MRKKRPIRILRIIARLNIGGPAIQAISLTGNLSDDDYQSLLVCGKVGPNEGDMSYLADEKDVKPYLLPELGREISFYNDLKCFLHLRRMIKRFSPDIIHTHTAKAGTLGRLAAMSLNFFRRNTNRIKLVHTFHGHIFHSYFGLVKTFIFTRIERFLSRFTDKIIVISPLQKDDICQKYRIANPEKVRTIPLGFDLSRFTVRHDDSEEIRRRYLPHDRDNWLLVGIIGRLAPVKNHRMFLEAVKRLKEDRKIDPFRFLIIGDGELKEDLLNYSKRLGIQDSVLFTGWQKDMPSIYGALDIVALTSMNEGTPVTLIEAMAAGKPVVATDVGGVRDLLGVEATMSDEGYGLARNGVLVPSGEGDILAKALQYLMVDRKASKTMAMRAREFVLNQFSMERLVKDMKSLYSELVCN